MARQFKSHPCSRCDVKQSVQGMFGFCSQDCRNNPTTSTKSQKRRQQAGSSAADPSDDRPAKRPSTKGQPLGSTVFALFWFSITITLSNGDICVHGNDDKFALIKDWLDTFCVRGCFGVEHGKKCNQKHLQGCAEIRAPPPEQKGHLLVSKSIRLALRIISKGHKITVKYFTKTQTPSAMAGYCMKDMR